MQLLHTNMSRSFWSRLAGWGTQEPLRKKVQGSVLLMLEAVEFAALHHELISVEVGLKNPSVMAHHGKEENLQISHS